MDTDFIFYSSDKLYIWSHTDKRVRLWDHSDGRNPATEAKAGSSDDDANLGDAYAFRAAGDSGEPDGDSPAD